MRLRMLIHISGTHDDVPWPEVGGIVELAHAGAVADLVRNGYAEIVREPEVETATVAPPETTAHRIRKRQRVRKASR